MFNHIWKKYFPILAILIKRSSTGEQQLKLNQVDFERAAGGRKIKYTFSNLHLVNGKIDNTQKTTPLAKDFAQLMREDTQLNYIIAEIALEFTLKGDFTLLIKNNSIVNDIEETTLIVTEEV